MSSTGVACLAAVFAAGLASAGPVQPDAQTIIKLSVAANERDFRAQPKFTYFKQVLDQQVGENGEITTQTTRTYHVLMIDGSPYERLVAINNRPLPPDQQKAEEKKLEEETSHRRQETRQQRKERIANYEEGRKRDNVLMQQMTKGMDFHLAGTEKIGNYDVYVLTATPHPGYNPPNDEAKVLTGMKGTLWIDKNTYQWVKVQAEVIQPVSIKGFVARVEPGTRFELEKMPVDRGIWLPKHFAMKADYRVFFLFANKKAEEQSFFGYTETAPQQQEIAAEITR